MRSKNSTAIQLLLYIVAGFTTLGVEYVVFLIAFYLVGLPVVAANIISFCVALLTSFLLNKRVVFKVDQSRHGSSRQMVQYVCLAICNLLITTTGIYYVVEAGVPAFLAKLGFIGLIASWNFVLFKKVIFADQNPTLGSPGKHKQQ